MKRLRIYADTSVFGGCFDDEFSVESHRLLKRVIDGAIILVISDLVLIELDSAPIRIRKILDNFPSDSLEFVTISSETERLCESYLNANVVGPSSRGDAYHIAIATVNRVDLVVSWNFKHIVHFEKVRRFNAVNLLQGYQQIDIRAPK